MLIGNPMPMDISPPELSLFGGEGGAGISGVLSYLDEPGYGATLVGNAIQMNVAPPELTLFVGGGSGISGVSIVSSPRSIPHIQLIFEEIERQFSALIIPTGILHMLYAEPIPIDILPFRPETEPGVSFKRYHITLYPAPDVFDEESRIGGRVIRFYKVGIALYRKVPKRARKRFFSSLGDTIAGVGVLEMTNYVMDALRNNTLGGLVNMTAGRQFQTPEVVDLGEDFLERVDLVFQTEMLHTVDSDGVP